MKYVVIMMAVALFAGKASFANDAENKAESTVDVSENPITGTVKTKKVKRMKHKDMAGNMHSKKTTETTKEKTDGSMTKEVETKEEAHH